MMKQQGITTMGKNLLRVVFVLSIILISITYAYEPEKGKIDMHGGKGDSLTSGNGLGMAMGLGSVLNKKGSSEEKKDEKNFISLEKKEKIEKIEEIKGNY